MPPTRGASQPCAAALRAFFARLRVKHGYGEYRRTWYIEDEGEVEHPVTKKPVAAKVLGGSPLPLNATAPFAPTFVSKLRCFNRNWLTTQNVYCALFQTFRIRSNCVGRL